MRKKKARSPFANYRTVVRRGFLVAELVEPAPPLTAAEVRRLTRALRERRAK